MTGRAWLKPLDLIQLKAMLWQGDPPLEISRRFLVTQSTISAIKNGRLHPDAEWPDGSSGTMPEYRNVELGRLKKMGMLDRSEKATGRGQLRDPSKRFPAYEREQTDEEIWMDAHRYYEEYKSGEITEDDLKRMWLVEKQSRDEAKARKEQEEWERRERRDLEQLAYEATLPEETQEEREEWEREIKQEMARRNLWKGGKLVQENLVSANLTDEQILQIIKDNTLANAHKTELLEFIEERKAALVKKETDDVN